MNQIGICYLWNNTNILGYSCIALDGLPMDLTCAMPITWIKLFVCVCVCVCVCGIQAGGFVSAPRAAGRPARFFPTSSPTFPLPLPGGLLKLLYTHTHTHTHTPHTHT